MATGICESNCVPNCEGMTCGYDPVCGQKCDNCEAGKTCNPESGECEGGNQDYSWLMLKLMYRTSATTGPANQCYEFNPEPYQGSTLPTLSLAHGYKISGVVRHNDVPVTGAQVAIVKGGTLPILEEDDCLPDDTDTTSSDGAYSFYVHAGVDYHVRAIHPNGLVAHAVVTSLVSSDYVLDISFPQFEDQAGGPLEIDAQHTPATDTVVKAYYRQGSDVQPGWLANNGVTTDANGEFVMPLRTGGEPPYRYDFLAFPPFSTEIAPQVISGYEDIEPPAYLVGKLLREGAEISGSVEYNNIGVAGCSLRIQKSNDPRIVTTSTTQYGGNYAVLVRNGMGYKFNVNPSSVLFDEGGAAYQATDLIAVVDTDFDVDLSSAQAVVFSGKLVDSISGEGVVGQVRLLVQAYGTGKFSFCDPNFVDTNAEGEYSIRCNVITY
jgi:hypothetical protein